MLTGLPKTVVMSSDEVRHALEDPVGQILDAIRQTLDKTPPWLAADIMDRGVMLAGGALLTGLDERMRHETHMPVRGDSSPVSRSARARASRSSRSSTAARGTGAATGAGRTAGSDPPYVVAVPQASYTKDPRASPLLTGSGRSAPTGRRPVAPAGGTPKAGRPLVRRATVIGLVILSLALLSVYFRESSSGTLHGMQDAGASVIHPSRSPPSASRNLRGRLRLGR